MSIASAVGSHSCGVGECDVGELLRRCHRGAMLDG